MDGKFRADVRKKVSYMKNPNETQAGVNVAEKGKPGAEKQKENLKVCHPSVCIGSQKPTSCVCITEK
jgi:hypothetical protein